MEEVSQLGMFEEPKGDLLCTCGHLVKLHKRKGKGECQHEDCDCTQCRPSGARAKPRARKTDPPTSHQAAASVRHPTKNQVGVLRVLESHGPITDETLVKAYEHCVGQRNLRLVRGGVELLPQQSPSGIRTRRKELTDAGLVVEHDQVRGDTGRMMSRWRLK